MPELTIASALSRTICSFTLQANLFQLFQPIGGVSARPLGALFTTSCVVSAATAEENPAIAATHINKQKARFITIPALDPVLALALPNGDANRVVRGELMRRLRGLLSGVLLTYLSA